MAGPLVLVVEDRQSLADLLCDALIEAGYDAAPTTYRDVQPMAAAHLPGLILLNNVERRPQAARATQQLQADPATRAIPVLATPNPHGVVRSATSADERSRLLADALAEVVAAVANRIGPA